MTSVSNTRDASTDRGKPSREQCIRDAAGVFAMWRAEHASQEVAA